MFNKFICKINCGKVCHNISARLGSHTHIKYCGIYKLNIHTELLPHVFINVTLRIW